MFGMSELRLPKQTTDIMFGPEIKPEDEGHVQFAEGNQPKTRDGAVLDFYEEAWDASVLWQSKFRRLYEKNILALHAYETDLLCTVNQIDELRRENENLEEQIKNKDTEKNNLVENLRHILEAKERIFEECEKQRFQREFSELIVSQYREEIEEYKATLKEKDKAIEDLVELVATVEPEAADLKVKPGEAVKEWGQDKSGHRKGGQEQCNSVVVTAPSHARRSRRRRRGGSATASSTAH